MNTLSAAWVLALKDLKSFVRDRSALMLSVLVPIALVTVFGWIMAYAFGGSSGMPKVTLHVIDESELVGAEQLIVRLEKHEMLRVKRLPAKGSKPIVDASGLAEKLVRDGDANHVLLLRKPKSPDEGKYPEQVLVRDPGRQMDDRIVQLALMQVTIQEQGDKVFLKGVETLLAKEGMAQEDIQSIRGWMNDIGESFSTFFAKDEKPQSDEPAPATGQEEADVKQAENGLDLDGVFKFAREVMPMETVDVAPPDRDQRVTYQQAQSVCGMSVMMLLFALTSCGSVLLTERENGTLRRLFAQPISRNSILLGKFLFVFVVGMLQMTVLFCYGEWMFQVGLFRDIPSLAVITVTWVATAGAFGVFLAAVSRSSRQAESLASLLILMMAALGGCWFPLQMMNLPPLLDTVCKSTMTYWAMTGYQGMLWNQLPWYSTNTLVALGWQWTWCLGLTVLSIYFYRRNYCRG
jgi:ABC-2 type transport system permease protein